MNKIEESGLPLAFRVNAADVLSIPPAPHRKGLDYRTAVRSLTAMQKEALVLTTAGIAWRLTSDEGPYLNGFDMAPAPLGFLTAGMVSSYMMELRALARERGITLHQVRMIQDNYYTMEGSAPRGTMVAGALPVDLEIQIESDGETGAVNKLLQDAVHASPLNGLMRGRHESLFTLTVNGEVADVGRVPQIPEGALSDPSERFDDAEPRPTLDEALIRKVNAGEITEGAGGRGSSLKSDQQRTLHVQGICEIRSDGLLAITQHLFNPKGSSFQFIADETGEQAPDPATLISAGLGFCFMTQLGRYAQIMKKDLSAYRILQDTFFTPGGGSGRTGKAGEADPVETHVYLNTTEGEDFAREVVDMGEQTCFLHAFCKTDLKTRIRSTSYRQVG
ncbi:OsmC family protein [Marinobacter sp. ATCH36]|uniref:OsmC family protein n=1 Tax=Marinobacter sp. ATCH36 TaxID=2945106 RepID=UPI002020AA07|nr:OsmC family protein [Marinobacter sp. ATCH36]MCL7942948.1 OsmC family protein [Marinobacter sp. ATCH36]